MKDSLDYWRKCAENAESDASVLAERLLALLDETHDWASALCGEREGLDYLRARCLRALQDHPGESVDFRAKLEGVQRRPQPWLKPA